MPKSRPPYRPDLRRQMLGPVHARRTLKALARDFQPNSQANASWVRQTDRDADRRDDGLTSAEREEVHRLRREAKPLRLEREMLAKAAAGFARRTDSIPPPRLRVHQGEPRRRSDRHDVPPAGSLRQWVLCMASSWAIAPGPGRRGSEPGPPEDPADLPRYQWGAEGAC